MKFSDYADRIAGLGREVNLDLLTATRKLVAPLHEVEPFPDVAIQRDLRYGEHERQRLDIFTGKRGGPRPLLIFVHGGGFVAGDKYTPGTPFYDNVGVWAVRHGCNAVNMTYRLAPAHAWPAGVEDIHRVVRWLLAHGAEHDLAQGPIFLMGQSAGAAHAAAYLAHAQLYAPDPHHLAGAVLLSGLYDFTSMRVSEMERAYLGEDASRYGERSSLAGVADSDLPLLVALAEWDPPFFESQTLQLLSARQQARGKMPKFVHMMGQNHLSGVLYLGLEGDLLGPQIDQFIKENR